MKMRFLSTVLFVATYGFTLLAHADLTITNNTKLDSTSIMNNTACSTILGEKGITHAGQTNVIEDSKIKFACMFHAHDCKADVYMTANCSGAKVATVIFDTKKGIQHVDLFDKNFSISGSGFVISMDGGPQ